MMYYKLPISHISTISKKAYLIKVPAKAGTGFYYEKELTDVSFWIPKAHATKSGEYLLIKSFIDINNKAIVNANERLSFKGVKLLNPDSKHDMRLWNPDNSSTWYINKEYQDLGIDLKANRIDFCGNIVLHAGTASNSGYAEGDAGFYGESIDSIDGNYY